MAKPFDVTTKVLIEAHPLDWLRLANLPIDGPVEVIDSDLAAVTASADKVLRVGGPRPWLAHLELQAAADASLPARVKWYNGLLRYRHGLPVLSLVVLLRPQADGPGLTGIVEEFLPDGARYQEFRYRILRVWEGSVEKLLTAGVGTLPLAFLSDEAKLHAPSVVERVSQRLCGELTPAQTREFWAASRLLLGLRYNAEAVERWLKGVNVMSIYGIEESSTYQEILAKGVAQGVAQGVVQGTTAGEIAALRRTLLRLGRRRLGVPPADVELALSRITDRQRLEDLNERLLTVDNWHELLA